MATVIWEGDFVLVDRKLGVVDLVRHSRAVVCFPGSQQAEYGFDQLTIWKLRVGDKVIVDIPFELLAGGYSTLHQNATGTIDNIRVEAGAKNYVCDITTEDGLEITIYPCCLKPAD